MPVQTGKSSILSKVKNLDNAVKQHAADETTYGFVRLPGGIASGVAQLKECGFKLYESDTKMKQASGQSAAGLPYFYAVGVAVEPPTHDGQKVAGLQTRIQEPMFDTADSSKKVTTGEQHVAKVMLHMRRLASPDFTANVTCAADLEPLAQALEKVQPYFSFSTTVGKPQTDPLTGKIKLDPTTGKPYEPRVWENWNGNQLLQGYIPPESGAMADSTPAKPAASGNGQKPPSGKQVTVTDDKESDIESLVSAAASEDVKAQDTLKQMAMAVGKTEEEVDNADNWQAVADMIAEASSGWEGEGAPAEETKTWEKGEACVTRVVNPKTNRKVSVQCKVESVDKAKGTATVKRLDTKALIKNVPLDDLEEPAS